MWHSFGIERVSTGHLINHAPFDNGAMPLAPPVYIDAVEFVHVDAVSSADLGLASVDNVLRVNIRRTGIDLLNSLHFTLLRSLLEKCTF